MRLGPHQMALQDHVGRREEEDRRATRARKAPWAPLEREVETGSQEFVGPRASRAATAQTGSRELLGHKEPRVSEVPTEFVEPRACRAETG